MNFGFESIFNTFSNLIAGKGKHFFPWHSANEVDLFFYVWDIALNFVPVALSVFRKLVLCETRQQNWTFGGNALIL